MPNHKTQVKTEQKLNKSWENCVKNESKLRQKWDNIKVNHSDHFQSKLSQKWAKIEKYGELVKKKPQCCCLLVKLKQNALFWKIIFNDL